jgi:hypothetical protein
MNRFSVERGGVPSDATRRRTQHIARTGRWTDKVFVIPSAVVSVITKMNHSFFGAPAEPQVQPSLPRRQRGFYVWRPTIGPDGKPYALGGMVRMIEEVDPRHTAENPMPKRKDIS